MNVDFVQTQAVQELLDRASGTNVAGGNARLKAVLRDFLESTMELIVKHDVSESEFWQAIAFLQQGAGEFGLLVPGVGLEHFLDLYMDAKDAEAGRTGGTRPAVAGFPGISK